MPTDDDACGPGTIREYYKLLATTPAGEAFRPLKDGGCPLVRS